MSNITRGSSLPKEDSNKDGFLSATFERSVKMRRTALRKGEVCICPSHMRHSGRLSGITKRVHTAFHKAFKAREKYLGRPLTHKETYALFDAVKKNSNVRLLPREEKSTTLGRQSKQLRDLAIRTERLEAVRPTCLSEVHDKMELVKIQIQMLQSLVFHLTMEAEQVVESCPHFKHKKVQSFEIGADTIEVECQDFKALIVSGNKEILCCSSCLEKREDFCFSKFGSLPKLAEDKGGGGNTAQALEASLNGVHLLQLSSVWAELLNHIYDRRI